ncbi:hypothetical protein [Pelagovum pacificum]|uniref:Uncharacterized protein n=1 Tax=Pelagovum pacificum TaxID=2588711 RepID=A0A5C5GE37_9RHOB|nr:hypothetical protein [Pelagovum pacificum]QQA43901.1 hypothetical protein I8N54_04795 [Pelagovum pacificum]TNY32968.1 hypothetical protein FHY64_06745 [Pelagovum pacificum]
MAFDRFIIAMWVLVVVNAVSASAQTIDVAEVSTPTAVSVATIFAQGEGPAQRLAGGTGMPVPDMVSASIATGGTLAVSNATAMRDDGAGWVTSSAGAVDDATQVVNSQVSVTGNGFTSQVGTLR